MSRDRLRGDESGVSSLELSVIAPSLLLLIFFVVQVAFYLYGRTVALQAAREGVSQLRLEQNPQDFAIAEPGVKSNVETFAKNIGTGSLDNPAMKATYSDAKGRVTVTVTGETVSLVPFLGLHLHVTETVSGQVERFQDGG